MVIKLTETWRHFYEASVEPFDQDEFLVIYLNATNPDVVEQVLCHLGYQHSAASNILGIKLGEYAFSDCDLTQFPGEEKLVDAIILYHSLPKCWSSIGESKDSLSRKKSLIKSWFLIPPELIIDFGYDYLDELEDEARATYP